MTTTAQIAANQANAQKSTGPKSPEGKDKVSRNATRHGLTSTKLILTPEEQAEYDQITLELASLYNPQSSVEWMYLRRAVDFQWRLDGCVVIEQAFMTECANRLMQENEGITHQDAMGLIFLDDRFAPRLNLYMRYHGQLDRGYRRAIADLEKTLEMRERAAEVAAEAARAAAGKPEQDEEIVQIGFVSYAPPQPSVPAGNHTAAVVPETANQHDGPSANT